MKTNQTTGRRLAWLAATLVVALASGCGGGGGGDPAPAQPPGTGTVGIAPIVTAVTPRPNVTGVPINTRIITALFSKAMDPTSLTPSSFTLVCPSGAAQSGSVAFDANNNLATLTLANTLPVVTLCTATINAKDASGVPMATSFSWSFQSDGAALDTTAPTVTSAIHTLGQTNVPVNTKVGVTFSEAMDPLTITNANFMLVDPVTAAPVAGRVSYSGVNALFVPSGILRSNTKYTVIVKGAPNGVKDVRGNLMTNDFVNSWTTGLAPDRTAPMVSSTINANSATNVPINTNIGATFSEVMNPLTINGVTMTVRETGTGAAVAGVVSYAGHSAVFTSLSNLSSNTRYTVNLKGGVGGVTDLVGNPMTTDYTWSWTTTGSADTTVPAVVMLNPADLSQNVAVNGAVHATFSKDMNPLTINTGSFRMAGVNGTVTYDEINKIASFKPSVELAVSTTYIVSISTAAKDMAGNSLAATKVWSISTAATVSPPSVIDLGSASSLGLFSDSLGMSNSGTHTVINGDIASTAAITFAVTGFHDTEGYIYSETAANIGTVNGAILTCINLATLPVIAGPAVEACPLAVQAGMDVQTAYAALTAMSPGTHLASNLANRSLAPGIYASDTGAFQIEGGDLTLDGQGNVDAVWIFLMPSTLTVGSATQPQNVILSGGAQAKNVFWQVGGLATINAAGGGNMVGTVMAHSGATLSSAGKTVITNLQGRVFAPGASITVVNAVINVPAP